VILPQAVRVVLPPLGNDFIAMLKDSALISVLALPDILQLGRLYISRTFRAFEGYNTVALLYLLMTLFLSLIVRIIERRSRQPGSVRKPRYGTTTQPPPSGADHPDPDRPQALSHAARRGARAARRQP